MSFEHEGLSCNLLDTPGQQDFSENTYRTLTAVDSAVMVLDAKGIQEQTRKLFEVCRLRAVPIITFVNKLDREGRDPFDLIDEVSRPSRSTSRRPPGRSAWGAIFSAPMTSLLMRSYCSSAASTTGSPSRSAAMVSTTPSLFAVYRKPPSPNCARSRWRRGCVRSTLRPFARAI
jgi:hypothetical protein